MTPIYLRHGDEFVAMHQQPYEAEDVLQSLLADHPEVLAGGEQDGDGRGWVLIKREAGVADAEDAADRWSLDHLFLDSDGVPTLVEVKRSTDTRARREVVAQMLDYAANGTAFWKVDALRAWFETECEQRAVEPVEVLQRMCGVEDAEEYWDRVRTNLAASRIRLVFVSDEIAPELRSIVEFLNSQMTDTEVLAVEVKQYVDAGGQRQTVVPQVVGQTEAAKAAKATGTRVSRYWDRNSLVMEIRQRAGDREADVAGALIDWATTRGGVRVDYGKGTRTGTAGIRLEHAGARLHAFNILSYDAVEIPFDFMRDLGQEPFATERGLRDELRRLINEAVPGAAIPPEEQRPRPGFSLKLLADDSVRERFLAAIDWALEKAARTQAAFESETS